MAYNSKHLWKDWVHKFDEQYGISFDDVLVIPRKSDILPAECDTSSKFSRNVGVKIPIASSAMDTVSEPRLAIALAKEGGISIIHRHQSAEKQAKQVDEVKRHQLLVIESPVSVYGDMKISEFYKWRDKNGIHYKSFPVVDRSGKLKGFLTKLNFLHANPDHKIYDVMLKPDRFLTGDHSEWLGNPEKVYRHLCENLKSGYPDKFIITNDKGEPNWMYDMDNLKSLLNSKSHSSNIDSKGRLIVGAAIGVGDYERAEALAKAGVDVIVVDSAHGHSSNVIDTVEYLSDIKEIKETVKELKKKYKFDVVAGNIATHEAAYDLAKAGADGLKVGIGPGSICTTRIVAGIGVPQVTAIIDCAQVADAYGIPLIADGGIRDKTARIRRTLMEAGYKNSGDTVKAIVAGAHCAMIGNLFAGVEESPSEKVVLNGQIFKCYRGMGSESALKERQSTDRYKQKKNADKFVPEGVEGVVPYKGLLRDLIYQLVGGLRAGMGYTGVATVDDLREKGKFILITKAAKRESHPHNLKITRNAPNYFGH